MSKITFTDDAGNVQGVTLPAGINVTVAPPAAPVPPPAPPPAPKIIGQTLSIDKAEIHVGDTFNVSGTLQWSEGPDTPITATRFWGFDASVVNNGPHPGNRTFTATKEGATTIKNDDLGTTGSITVTVLPAVAVTPPPSVPPVDPPPAPPASPSGLAAAVVTGTVNGKPVSLTVQLGVRAQLIPGDFAMGSIWYASDGSITPENAYVGLGNRTPSNLDIDLTIVVGDKTFTTGKIVLGWQRWTQPFWVVEPTVKDFDRTLFPELVDAPNASFADQYAKANNGVLGTSFWDVDFAGQGGRFDLGLIDGASAAYLCNPTPENAAVVRGLANATAPIPFHAIDTATNKMLLASDWPHASTLGAEVSTWAAGNPFDVKVSPAPSGIAPPLIKMSQAAAHAPAFNALACALFGGTEYDKESLAQWTNYIARLWGNWSSCLPNGPNINGQTRGTAWTLRSLAQAARMADVDGLFAGWLKQAIAGLAGRNAKRPAGTMPMDPTNVVYPPGDGTPTNPYRGYSLFQIDYKVAAIGYVIQLGFTDAQPLLDWWAPLITDRTNCPYHEMGTIYEAIYKDANGNVAKDWLQSLQWTAANKANLTAAMAAPEDSAERMAALRPGDGEYRPGDYDGYPWSPTGYPAFYRAALHYVVKYGTDQTAAQSARTKALKYLRADFSQDPKDGLAL